jgi:hypothetical protein
MNTETTLAIIAVLAAFGLLTTLMVVEPIIQQADAQISNRQRACQHTNEPFFC